MERPLTSMNQEELISFIKKAHQLRENNQLVEALDIAKICFKEAPREPEVLFLLGALQFENKDFFHAEKSLTTAIALNPNKAEYFLFLGNLLLVQGRNLEAEKVLRRAIDLDATLYMAYYYLGKVLSAQNKLFEALAVFQKGVAQNPQFSKFQFNLAAVYHKLGKKQEAISAYQESLKFEPNNTALLSNYGAILSQDRQYLKAIGVYEAALKLEPNHIGAMSNLAGTYIELGELDKAEKLLRQSLAIEPNAPSLWRNLTLCVTYDTLYHPDVLKIQQLLEKETVPSSLAHYYFALGKIYLNCKEYDKSFEYYAKGNALRAREASFRTEVFKAHINLIMNLFDDAIYRKFTIKKKKLPEPIFIIGTSRSGKSLLEEILSHHPHIHSAGELGFAETIAKLPAEQLPPGNYPFWAKQITPDQAKAMRRAYLRRLLQYASPTHQYVIDTLPGNFMYLGVLAMLFPDAKFIHCKRDPLDACLLIHFKYFVQGHSYTNEIAKLGSYYQQYTRLMKHWHSVLPKQILDVDYEELVTDPQRVVAKTLQYLDVDEKLSFNFAKFNRDEIGIHHQFDKHLNPLKTALGEPFLIHEAVDVKALYLADLINSAKYHFMQGDYPQAERLALSLLEETPENAAALYLMGSIYLKMQFFQKASHYFEKALEISPKMVPAYIDLAATLQALGRHIEANAKLRIADKLSKDLAQGKINLSQEVLQKLHDAFSQEVKVFKVNENKILFKTPASPPFAPDSYLTKSWDRYFTDLSFGSFRDTVIDGSKVWRMRTWHFLFKNMALIHQIYSQAQHEIRVLDLGCSTGYLRRFLEGNFSLEDKKTIYYWGVDIREDNLLQAVQGTEDLESGAKGHFIPSAFLAHDFKDPLPFKENYFDYIVNFEAIKYLPVAQGRVFLKEMQRVLKDSGRLCLSTSYSVDKPGFMETVPFEEIERMLHESGFDIVQTKGSQATWHALTRYLKKEHIPFVNELLKVHPPEMVAAMITPVYPQCSSQVTFLCKKSVLNKSSISKAE